MQIVILTLVLILAGVSVIALYSIVINKSKTSINGLKTNSMSKKENIYLSDSIDHYQEGITIDESRPSPIAMIYKSEMEYISRCILDYPNIETGGQLFGFWTTEGIPVVMYTIGPGPNSEHHVVHFIQDSDYLARVGDILINKYGLQHIGEWHSHHQLGLAKPSGQDSIICSM